MRAFRKFAAPCALLCATTVRADDTDILQNQTTFEEINSNVDRVLSVFVELVQQMDNSKNWIESLHDHVESNSLFEVEEPIRKCLRRKFKILSKFELKV